MRRAIYKTLVAICVVGGAFYLDHRADAAREEINVTFHDPRKIALTVAPIRPDWVLDGHPVAEAAKIGETTDGTTRFLTWRISAGRINWHYDDDETITIVDGDVYITEHMNAPADNPAERHLVAGDVVFFPAGSEATWRIRHHVQKTATLRRPMPWPISTLHRWGRTVKALFRSETSSMGL